MTHPDKQAALNAIYTRYPTFKRYVERNGIHFFIPSKPELTQVAQDLVYLHLYESPNESHVTTREHTLALAYLAQAAELERVKEKRKEAFKAGQALMFYACRKQGFAQGFHLLAAPIVDLVEDDSAALKKAEYE